MQVSITVHFRRYVSHPYWPEREKVINITKESGVNRARSEANREKALSSYLTRLGMTLEQYQELVRLAERPFAYNGTGTILIPQHNIYGMFAEATDLAPSALRLARVEQIRTVLHTTDWATAKRAPDGVWSRFVQVKSGTGAMLSNQRSLRENSYIEDFDATGTLHFSVELVRPEKVRDFLTFAGANIGLGASRKLDNGRFAVTGWEEEDDA